MTYPIQASAVGTQACTANTNLGLSQANTCNGKWDGYGKVRRSITIVFSGGEIGFPSDYNATIPASKRTALLSLTNTSFDIRLADLDGNPLPADGALSVSVVGTAGTCVPSIGGSVIGSSIEPTEHRVTLAGCASGQTIAVKVAVTSGSINKTSQVNVTVP